MRRNATFKSEINKIKTCYFEIGIHIYFFKSLESNSDVWWCEQNEYRESKFIARFLCSQPYIPHNIKQKLLYDFMTAFSSILWFLEILPILKSLERYLFQYKNIGIRKRNVINQLWYSELGVFFFIWNIEIWDKIE